MAAGKENGFAAASPSRPVPLPPYGLAHANGGSTAGAAGGFPGSAPTPAVPIPNAVANGAAGPSGSHMATYEPPQPQHRSGSGGGVSPDEVRAAAAALVGAAGLGVAGTGGHRTGSRPSTPTTSLEMQVSKRACSQAAAP